jgi:hypothetical protein
MREATEAAARGHGGGEARRGGGGRADERVRPRRRKADAWMRGAVI